MPDEATEGDKIRVGNITGSQGVAIGRNARAEVTGHNITGDVRIDSAELRSALEELYDAIGELGLSREEKIGAQTAAGTALMGVKDNEVDAESVTSSLEKVGKTLAQANVAVEQGTSLWENVRKLASLVGPLVGGARIVAGWFGVPLP
jgi:hypothetical protein